MRIFASPEKTNVDGAEICFAPTRAPKIGMNVPRSPNTPLSSRNGCAHKVMTLYLCIVVKCWRILLKRSLICLIILNSSQSESTVHYVTANKTS